ncbi:MAG: hypothetical protein KGM42_09460 [Hyphomicrobiales bacterium]|nr:hypothetical protein [Hyphomicrobiales bacterium]
MARTRREPLRRGAADCLVRYAGHSRQFRRRRHSQGRLSKTPKNRIVTSQPAGFLPGRHPIDAYGEGGFKFGGMSHRGSVLALPSGIYAWDATSAGDIGNDLAIRLLAEEAGSIEHVLVGTGMELVPMKAGLVQRLRAAHIALEPMATGAAARTYNVLLGERRRVAAALIAV